jgi:Ca2+-binding EF-hand superfamily protein
MSTFRIAALAFGCSLAAAPALAASESAEMQATDSLKTAEAQCGHFWTLVDTDNDQHVSAEEARAAVDKMMKSMDADASGDIGPEEYAECAQRAERAAYEEQQGRNRSEARFERYDTDDDGTVSVEEMLRAAEGEFEQADTDRDRQLSQAEMEAMGDDQTAMSEAADLSGDEKLSADEMAAQVRREFLTADRDRSGGIDIGEWTTMRQYAATEMMVNAAMNRFERIDADDDGVITAAEVIDYRTEGWGDIEVTADEQSGEPAQTQQAQRPEGDLGNVWIYRLYRIE